ncbi:glucosamine--fructose-6-phosphate aminotransferase (isomerizing) [Cohaesibacter sp. ES.047]|uniref:glutamine--fructose-6-phosphate transaminase (isomerizing) n=1 Tax=Cohaesibacter sp. ES.047 TaxID=1798205 RepID=UPI000BB82875|nr:glutamine--fructose-6-phosphate transaminase (isomerizing) [Cohaesibacter sp. ES.047]SNY93320.1 glucosamine--fructose-6-phosphate aminotransferase (isomerizing) [Cohaesibacter sp. ES.047]
MCGIVGILGKTPVSPQLVDALKRLEYRGYDSAGVATISDGQLGRRRAPGKLRNLEQLLEASPLPGNIGIGHTRWATHGIPNETNAHPHQAGNVAAVHNGIIENFRELRDELTAKGHAFETETDTETVVHLIQSELNTGKAPVDAVAAVLGRLHGAFSLGIIFGGEEDLMIGARRGSPLAVGHGDGEMFLGSDAFALAPFTDEITYLEEGDWVVLGRTSMQIYDEANNPVTRAATTAMASANIVEKGNYKHFMEKEMHEQPEVIQHTLAHYVDFAGGTVRLAQDLPFDFAKLSRIAMSACGTAYYAGVIAKYWFEKLARLPVDIDVASEFRYREMPMEKDGLALFISQSGETADTLACLRYCRAQGQHIASIVNVTESTIARESDAIFPTLAGPEIGVASTKAFTCQLSVLLSLAIMAGRARGTITSEEEQAYTKALSELPRYIREALKASDSIAELAHDLSKVKHVLYLGRGTNFPLAMEGALKLKEISYIHAEGYAAGELKHGPIALIDETMPVVVIAPHDSYYDKTVSNMQEVAARDGRIILITDQAGAYKNGLEDCKVIEMPTVPEIIAPIVFAMPVQLLAYHTANFMGTDVDQPRNLAKSVTVE